MVSYDFTVFPLIFLNSQIT